MDFLGERGKPYKSWKAPKMRKRVKTSMLSRIPNSISRMCKRLFGSLFRPASPYTRTRPMSAVPLQPLGHHNPLGHHDPDFMGCVIKVDTSKRGWHKTVKKVSAKCEDRRIKIDESGVVEVSGICDSDKVLDMLGKSRRAKTCYFQSGHCSKYLFVPEAKTKGSSQPQPQPNYNHNPIGPYNMPYIPNHGFGYYQQLQPEAYVEHTYPSHQGYGYHHYQPHPEYSLPYYGY